MCKICYVPQLEKPKGVYAMAMEGIVYINKKYTTGETITIQFKDFSQKEKDFVMNAALEWLKYANLKFKVIDGFDTANIRITANPNLGSWSYLGTDSTYVRRGQATMNFGWLAQDMLTNDHSTILHEFGHGALAMPHEHQNPYEPIQWDREKVYKRFGGAPNFWDKKTIDHNILNVLSTEGISATPLDKNSIMAYFFDADLTLNGVGMPQNKVLSETDKAFAAAQYPYPDEPEVNVNVELKRFLSHYFLNSIYINRATKQQLLICLGWLSIDVNPTDSKEKLLTILKEAIKNI